MYVSIFLILEPHSYHLSYTDIIMWSVYALSLNITASFLYTPALCPHLSQIVISPSSFSPISPPFFNFYFLLLFFTQFLSFLSVISCGCMCVCVPFGMYVWMSVWFCSVCVCVIIARPPRGNQHWSLDSPDPLMPQHKCPRGAVPLSSVCVCGCTICPPAWWRWSGHVASPTGDLHTHKRTHTQQRKPRGWGIKR